MNPKKTIAIVTLFFFAGLNAHAETSPLEHPQDDSGAYQYEEQPAHDSGEYGGFREEMEPPYEAEPEIELPASEVWEQDASDAAYFEAQGQQEILQDSEIIHLIETQEVEEDSQYIYEELREEAEGGEEYYQDPSSESQVEGNDAQAVELEQPL